MATVDVGSAQHASPDGPPPITVGAGLLRSGWIPGPQDATDRAVVVSFTDFRAGADEELTDIFATGLELSKSWPIMNGAVGLWLWGKPSELRGGSVSVWRTDADLRRFVGWPVHAAIVRAWRPRIEVLTQHWTDARFDRWRAWSRAEAHMRAPRRDGGPDREV